MNRHTEHYQNIRDGFVLRENDNDVDDDVDEEEIEEDSNGEDTNISGR